MLIQSKSKVEEELYLNQKKVNYPILTPVVEESRRRWLEEDCHIRVKAGVAAVPAR
jgi:hypothetical protein